MSEQNEPHQSHIPEFQSYEEEADWWDSTDTGAAEYKKEELPPFHQELAIGTLRNILRQAGVSP